MHGPPYARLIYDSLTLPMCSVNTALDNLISSIMHLLANPNAILIYDQHALQLLSPARC